MQPRPVSTASLILVAMIFGVVQVLCLCGPASAQALVPAPSQMVHDSAPAAGGHALHLSGDQDGEDGHAACDDGVHCDNDAAITSVYPPQSSIVPASNDLEKSGYVRPSPIPQTRASMAASALAGLRWLDPPRILSTPVSAKVRLLN